MQYQGVSVGASGRLWQENVGIKILKRSFEAVRQEAEKEKTEQRTRLVSEGQQAI